MPRYLKCSAVLLILIPMLCPAQKIWIAKELEIEKVAPNVYIYTAWAEIGRWGRVGSNGMVVTDNGSAFICDTPVDELQTRHLVSYIEDSLGAKVESFVPGHWHDDCVGGMAWLNSRGITTYANRLTNAILRSKSRPVAKHEFADSLTLHTGQTTITCYFAGGGHATDNIVVWLPAERILFGGCLVKDAAATNIGNTADAAPFAEWIATLERVGTKFYDAKIIIPGHGNYGGRELLTHTEALLQNKRPEQSIVRTK